MFSKCLNSFVIVPGEGGGGAGARRYARDAAASPAAQPPATPAHAHQTSLKIEAVKNEANVKSERLSPHDSNASRLVLCMATDRINFHQKPNHE